MTIEQTPNISYSKDEILLIAKMQKYYQWIMLIMIIFIFVYAPIAYIIGISLCFIVYKLAKTFKIKRPWTYVVGLFIPFCPIVVALSLMSKSTKVLKANKIRVGIMGCNKEDLAKFMTT
jgi:hypothetical protein